MAARHADAPALNTPGQALHATATEPPTPFGGVHFEHKLGQVIKRDGDETLWMVPIEVLAAGHLSVLDRGDSSPHAKQLAQAWLSVLQLADDKARLEGVDVVFTDPEVGQEDESGEGEEMDAEQGGNAQARVQPQPGA